MGLSYTGSSCLLIPSVTGCNRVPAPPASTIPLRLIGLSRAAPSAGRSLASVTVLEAHYVVFAEIRAGLYLDDFQRHRARVLDAMLHADRDVGRLVLFEKENFLAARDARRAGHHHPVLGAVMMQLQRQGGAGLYLQALHLEAR